MGVGQLITDGTAVWIVDDIRDGSRVGDIIIRPILRDGYVKANGATLKASEYPRLLRYAVDNSLTVTAAVYATDCSKYVYDSTADTLQVPNMTGRVLQGGDAVKSIEAGLPNITGNTSDTGGTWIQCDAQAKIGQGNGALNYKSVDSVNKYLASSNLGGAYVVIGFDASKSNSIYGNNTTVQPPALQMIPQIKY